MGNTTPTCPYCGAEMELYSYNGGISWMYCMECHALSPDGDGEADALAKALHRASPWHSVKDGLPDSGTICVVHGHNKNGVGCYNLARYAKSGWYFGGLSGFEVEHWMDVPDAPKEDDNADT